MVFSIFKFGFLISWIKQVADYTDFFVIYSCSVGKIMEVNSIFTLNLNISLIHVPLSGFIVVLLI